MKKIRITKRDIWVFFLGVLTVIIFDLLTNWEENKQDFLDGSNSVRIDNKK